MNSNQKKILNLLKEIHKICKENNITYYLSPQLTLCVRRGVPVPGHPLYSAVYMKAEEMEKFRTVLEERIPERRVLESMNNNKYFPGFYLRYTDLDTLYFNLNRKRNYKYPGIGIHIIPLRGKSSSRLTRAWNRIEELGWSVLNADPEEKSTGKKMLSGLLMRIRLLSGRGRLARSLYRHWLRAQKTENQKQYVVRLNKKTVYFPAKIFAETKTVELEGESFLVPSKQKLYLEKHYGEDYRKQVITDYTPFTSEIVSTHVGYEDYFEEVGSLRKVQKAHRKLRKKNEYGQKKKEYLNKSWDYAMFCGERMRLEKYYLHKKDYIRNLYKNKDYSALERIFVPYTDTIVKSMKYDEIFAPDEELLEIFLGTLEKVGRVPLKTKIEKLWR